MCNINDKWIKICKQIEYVQKNKTKTNGRQKVRGGPGRVKGANAEKSLSCMWTQRPFFCRPSAGQQPQYQQQYSLQINTIIYIKKKPRNKTLHKARIQQADSDTSRIGSELCPLGIQTVDGWRRSRKRLEEKRREKKRGKGTDPADCADVVYSNPVSLRGPIAHAQEPFVRSRGPAGRACLCLRGQIAHRWHPVTRLSSDQRQTTLMPGPQCPPPTPNTQLCSALKRIRQWDGSEVFCCGFFSLLCVFPFSKSNSPSV